MFDVIGDDLEATLVLKIINVVHSSYRAGRVNVEDHISFLVSVILCYQVGSGMYCFDPSSFGNIISMNNVLSP